MSKRVRTSFFRIFAPLVLPAVVSALLSGCVRGSEMPPPDCMPEMGACIQNGLSFSISPSPVRAMRELMISVGLLPLDGDMAGASGELSVMSELIVEFTMPGMKMGENRVRLKRNAHGIYEGKGILPRCPSGQRLWRAAVLAPGAAEGPGREMAVFLFEAR